MPKPAPVAPSKKRKRLIDEVPERSTPKPLLNGAVPLEAFLASLHKVGESLHKNYHHIISFFLDIRRHSAIINHTIYKSHHISFFCYVNVC